MNQEINSYGKILVQDHKLIDNLFDGEVLIQEKYDGSQFSMANIDSKLYVRSKEVKYDPEIDEIPNMFDVAVNQAKSIKEYLIPNAIYRCEYLNKKKHNCLVYDKIPRGNLVLFDVELEPGLYMTQVELEDEANRLNLEPVRCIFSGILSDRNMLKTFLEEQSSLGGTKIEGVVIKNYNVITNDGKLCKGKYVSPEFKENQRKDWGVQNPGRKDILASIVDSLRTKARYEKTVQHIKENGTFVNGPEDIGPCLKELYKDIKEEEEDYIKQTLYNSFIKDITRGVSKGFPEWYKDKLMGIDNELN